jgi:hypothetical protein
MSAADQAEFTRLIAELKKTVPDVAAFEALPPDVQKRFIDIFDRIKKQSKPQGNQ